MPAAPRTTMSCPTRRVRQPLPWQPPPPHHRIRPRVQLRRTSKRIPRTEVVAQTIPLIVVVVGRPSAPSVAQIVEQARRRCGGETTLATTSAMRAVSIYIYCTGFFRTSKMPHKISRLRRYLCLGFLPLTSLPYLDILSRRSLLFA